MAATLTVDTRQFNATLARAVRASSRAAQDVINNHAYAIAVYAAHATKIADKARIMHVLGQAAGPSAPTKSGKMPKAKWRQLVYREDSFAARIIQARRRDAGKPPLHGEALDKRIRKMIIGRAATVGFIASGFVRAARVMRRFTRGTLQLRETPKGIKVIPGGKNGGAIPARASGGIFGSGKFTAFVWNDVVLSGGRWQAKGMTFNPGSVAEAGLRAGMAKEEANIEKHLRDKMEKELKKVGAM